MWGSAKFHLKLRAFIQILDLYLVLLTEYIQDQESCQAPVYQAKESLTLASMILMHAAMTLRPDVKTFDMSTRLLFPQPRQTDGSPLSLQPH